MQQIQAVVTFPIPEESVLISKVEYEELKEDSLQGRFWTMKDLEKRLNRQALWIRDNILLRPDFKEELDVENGGFVFYPRQGTGEKWAFLASRMSEFLDKHFAEIFTS